MRFLPSTTLSAFALFALVHTADLGAQTCRFTPDSNPSTGATCDVIPFGTVRQDPTWVNQRYQSRITRAEMGHAPLTVRELSFAANGQGQHQSQEILIRMAHLDAPLDPDFDRNLGGDPTTVLHEQQHVFAILPQQWSPVGLTHPFHYDPARGDLLIDILVLGNHVQAPPGLCFYGDGGQRVHAAGWSGSSPQTGAVGPGALKMKVCDNGGGTILNYGHGCGSTLPLRMVASGLPNIGNPVDLQIVDGLPGSMGLLFLGVQQQSLPLDIIGMPGCQLWLQIGVTAGLPMDLTGRSMPVTLQIPNDPGFVGGQLFVQGGAQDRAANALGFAASDAIALNCGKKPMRTVKLGKTTRISLGFGTMVTKVTSSDPNVATVREDNRAAGGGFKVTGVARGTVTVTVRYTEGGRVKTRTVCVTVQ